LAASEAATATVQPPDLTTKLNAVVLLSGVPVTVTGYVPTGTEFVAEICRLLVHVAPVGVQEVGVNVAVAPVGRPEIPKETLSPTPEIRVTVIVLEPDPPGVALMLPEFDRT
jgi:hypothetical protein